MVLGQNLRVLEGRSKIVSLVLSFTVFQSLLGQTSILSHRMFEKASKDVFFQNVVCLRYIFICFTFQEANFKRELSEL